MNIFNPTGPKPRATHSAGPVCGPTQLGDHGLVYAQLSFSPRGAVLSSYRERASSWDRVPTHPARQGRAHLTPTLPPSPIPVVARTGKRAPAIPRVTRWYPPAAQQLLVRCCRLCRCWVSFLAASFKETVKSWLAKQLSPEELLEFFAYHPTHAHVYRTAKGSGKA